jgi:hypothetical protein
MTSPEQMLGMEPPSDSRPVHIVDEIGDDRTHCGIRLKDPKALPYVGRRFVDAHINGRPGITFCPACVGSNPLPWLRKVDDETWNVTDRD